MDDQYENPLPSRSQRHKKNTKPAVRIRPVLAYLLLAIILILGAVTGSRLVAGGQAPNLSGLTPNQRQAVLDQRALQNINILLVGCDQRENETARADTIMLATLRPADKEVSILSIPRDTLAPISGHGNDKINHALAYGGMDLLKQTVQDLLGAEINYTVQVNFDAFKSIIDALGGVTIDVETRMYKPLENIDLQPGLQHLNGYDALAYVRWREPIHADLGRIERQQKFLAALIDGIKNMNLKEALSVAGVIMDNLTTDMSVADMTRYASKFVGMTPDNIETHSLNGENVKYDGISYLKVSQQEIDNVMHLMKYGNPEPEENTDDNADNQQ